jgi:hypothetical protein
MAERAGTIMDMQPDFFSLVPCVRCGAYIQPNHPTIPCPHCGLPARFSLLSQGAADPESMPAALLGSPDFSETTGPAASSSRIPVLPAVAGEASFSGEELQALLRLRERYQLGDAQVRDDEFTAEERARLEFMRWLYRSGRLVA